MGKRKGEGKKGTGKKWYSQTDSISLPPERAGEWSTQWEKKGAPKGAVYRGEL